ncbi:MAG: GntR family transcriptional regulator [Desulfuromonadaceae bacterium]|nr:GntR family transcriptional regulator [Desulfuromonadaceae bacterium]
MAYQKKKSGSKQEIAYQYIKNAILNNEYAPDAMLVEGALCEQLGFSKTPIREALRRLATEKYVESIPEKGTFVTKLSLEDLIGIYEVREALEGMAARICAVRKDTTFIDRLQTCFDNTYSDLIEGKSELTVKEDMTFHHLILEGSRNKNLINLSNSIIEQINRFASTTINDPERLKLSFFEHKEVLNAIMTGDADLAEKKIREHIRSVKDYQIKKHYNIR